MTSSRLLLLLPPLLLLAACGEKDEDDGDDTGGDTDTDTDTDGGFDDTADSTRPDGGGCEVIAVTEVTDPETPYGDLTFGVADVMRGRDGDLVGTWSSSEDGDVPLRLSVIPDGSPSLVEQEPAATDTGWGGGTVEDTSYEETGPDSGERCPDYYDIPVRITWSAGDIDAPVLVLSGAVSVSAPRPDGAGWSLSADIGELGGAFDPGFDPAEWDEVSVDLSAWAGEPAGWRGDVSIQASRTDGDIGEGMVGLLGSFVAGPEGGPGGDSGAP